MPNREYKFVGALKWANEMHWDDRRKGTEIPYFSHCMSVAALVMEAGGDVDEAVAGLLHDVIEDCEDVEYEDVKVRFGKTVADIVLGLSDCAPAKGEEKPPWRKRKEDYLDHLRSTDNQSVLLVSSADKLHNVRSILGDLKEPAIGEKVWDRFSASKEDELWYYDELRKIFNERSPSKRLSVLLDEAVSKLNKY